MPKVGFELVLKSLSGTSSPNPKFRKIPLSLIFEDFFGFFTVSSGKVLYRECIEFFRKFLFPE
jgi:hypothetical protein